MDVRQSSLAFNQSALQKAFTPGFNVHPIAHSMNRPSLFLQAQEALAVADLTIQAILSGSAQREGVNVPPNRKRRGTEFYDQPAKRHSSLLSDVDMYSNYAPGPQQVVQSCVIQHTIC